MAEMTPERSRCGSPCLKHAHDCDRSPRHTGFHRDVQQKGEHTCEWDTPGPKDFPAVMAALRTARAEVAHLRSELDHMQDADSEATVWHDEFQQAKAERDRLAEQVRTGVVVDRSDITSALIPISRYIDRTPDDDTADHLTGVLSRLRAALYPREAGS